MYSTPDPLLTGPESDGFQTQTGNFFDSIRTGKPPGSDIDQAINLIKILMAIDEWSATEAEVRLHN